MQEQRPPRPKPRFRNSGRNDNNIKDKKDKTKSIKTPSPTPRRRRSSIGDHSVPKLTPVQRMRAAANRTITITTNAGLAGKKGAPKDKSSKRRGSSKKQNRNDDLDMPGCLDPNLAENHRKTLLEKYYNHRAANNFNAATNAASTSRASLETAITHIENSNEDALSEASDETLTNDTASVDTALDAHESTQSTVNDKTLAIEGVVDDSTRVSAGKQTLQAVKNYARNLVL